MHKIDKIEVSSEDLAETVTKLRHALDAPNVRGLNDIRQFDVALAHELHGLIFSPTVPLLEGVTHIMTVVDGPLLSLPFSVLVTEKPEGPLLNYEDYRDKSWLAKRYGLTTLPSISSLRALRLFAKVSEITDPFADFGDPVLEGSGGSTRGITVTSLFNRGPVVPVNEVRKLPPLPKTADELRQLADSLGADWDAIYLGERATEEAVKAWICLALQWLPLPRTGLLAGDLKGVAEPVLF